MRARHRRSRKQYRTVLPGIFEPVIYEHRFARAGPSPRLLIGRVRRPPWNPGAEPPPVAGSVPCRFVRQAPPALVALLLWRARRQPLAPAVVTQTVHVWDEPLGPRLCRRMVAWTADDDGKAEVWFDGREAPELCGLVDRLVTRPSVHHPPTANYDVTLKTIWGADLLDGKGENRSATTAEIAWIRDEPGTSGQAEVAAGRELHLQVANAGSGGAGVVALYVLEP